jgi:hypothetical protein
MFFCFSILGLRLKCVCFMSAIFYCVQFCTYHHIFLSLVFA